MSQCKMFINLIEVNLYKSISGYEGFYSIDSEGNVYSHRSSTVLKPSKCGRYHQVTFSVLGNTTTFYVHRLVYETFVGTIPANKVINHKDGNRENNNLNNLECISQKENIHHAYENNLNYKCPEGINSFNFKGEIEVYKAGVYVMSLFGHKDIEEKGFTSCGVSATMNGLQKSHRGCTFKRKEKIDV